MAAMELAKTLVVAIVTPGLLLACGGPEPSGDVKSGSGAGDAVKIVADDSFFEPDTLPLPGGDEVTLEVTNEGEMPHEFSIEELGISTGTIQPGQIKSITFEVPEASAEFVCQYHSGMTGTIEAGGMGEQR